LSLSKADTAVWSRSLVYGVMKKDMALMKSQKIFWFWDWECFDHLPISDAHYIIPQECFLVFYFAQ
jgi:hypothetical protein